MNKLASLIFGASLIGLSACSLPLSDSAIKTTNSCTTNAECGSDGACVTVDGAASCVATKSDLGKVILEVRPASDQKGDTVSHVFTDKLSLSGDYPSGAVIGGPGCVQGSGPASTNGACVDLQIPDNVTFKGEMVAAVKNDCSAPDGSIPVSVELHSVSTYSNLSSIYKADAVLADGKYMYSAQVPVGTYDVYLDPGTSTLCPVALLPPLLSSGIVVNGDTELQPKTKDSSDGPLELQGSIIVPDGTDVSQWKVEVVDPDYGLVISDSGTLAAPVGGTSQIGVADASGKVTPGIRYFYKAGAFIRCTAPDGKLVVHWSIDLLDPSMVKLSLADLLATTNAVEASVVDDATPPNPVAASVRIRSVMLTGDANQNSSFRVDTETDAAGKIHADLVAGTYQVLISPKVFDGTSATLVDTWEIKASSVGHAFSLPRRPQLKGGVSTPGGVALDQVSVLASPVATTQSYVTSALDAADVQPRNASGQTDASGRFQLLVDPGTVDFSVQPTASTGFPWLIIPRLLVSNVTPTDSGTQSLQTLTIPAPAMVMGRVSSTQGVVPSAVVRAWVTVPDPSDKTKTTVLQIGETVSDGAGNYVLPLPPSISLSANPT